MLVDGLIDAMHDVHMGATAENLTRRFAIERDEQDDFALQSHRKAAAAITAGRFDDEVTPIDTGPLPAFSKDEHPRPNLTHTDLSRLKTVSRPMDR